MRLLLASNNPHKVSEICALLAGTAVEIRCLLDHPELPEPPEDEDTFEGNALSKARFIYRRTRIVTVADDSGLVVDALHGAPGVHSKRFTPQATAAANNTELLRRMAGARERRARYVCAMAVVGPQGERVIERTCEGLIGQDAVGEGGFGYDPLFWPDAAPGRSMAQLSADEKNGFSHRGRAFAELPSVLSEMGHL